MDCIAYFEVCQKNCSNLSRAVIAPMVDDFLLYLLDIRSIITVNQNLVDCHKKYDPRGDGPKLFDHVDLITCSANDERHEIHMVSLENWKIFVYSLSQEEAAAETIQHESDELSVASHIILPSAEYRGLWESLYYDTNVKNNLLHFVETAMTFSDRKVDPNIVSWNKVVLLHGPPGTGKTSLCKALAQKVAIRLCERYTFFELVEINSHSLFSKWFSESGKLVMKLFEEVKRLLDNPETLVCVLIDEVESLAHARKSCANGTEPSDAIRVVNALLTQLDQIKSYPNVLILTTSNITEAIDLAFVDRADIKQYIGHPKERAIYQINRSCILELMRTNLLIESHVYPLESLFTESDSEKSLPECLFLHQLCKRSVGLSGRTLRKIPFLAYATHIRSEKCSFQEFLNAMQKVIEKRLEDDKLLEL